MRTWYKGKFVTRRMVERHLNEVFATPSGVNILNHARAVGLIAKGRQGPGYDRPLTGMERAALILVTALVAGTNLTLTEASRLVSSRQDWLREAMSCAVTGTDVKLRHVFADKALAVEVTIGNAVLRDPVIGLTPPLAMLAA